MAVDLNSVPAETGGTLTVLEQDGKQQSAKHGDKVLAVCQTSAGNLVLAREQTRGVLVNPSAPVAERKRDRDKGTEKYWKQTASLADWRDAALAGLIAF